MSPEPLGYLALMACAALVHSLWIAAAHERWLRLQPTGSAPATVRHVIVLVALTIVLPVTIVSVGSSAFYRGAPSSSLPLSDYEPAAGLQLQHLALLLTALWVAGLLIGITRLLVRGTLALRLLRGATETGEIQLDNGRKLQVLETDAAIGPCLIGIRRPALLVPRAIRDLLTDAQLTAVIRHESAHALHLDHLTEPALRLVQALLWVNPWVHRIAARIRLEREIRSDSCAASTSRERRQLAEGLLSLGEAQLAGGALRFAGDSRSELTIRIGALLSAGPPRAARGRALLVTGATLLAATALAQPTGHVLREMLGTRVINATDPGGEFKAVVEGARLDAVIIDGVPLQVSQRGRTAEVRSDQGNVLLRLKMRVHGFSWEARPRNTANPVS